MVQLVLKIISFLGLITMLVAAILYLHGEIVESTVNTYLMIGTFMYFATAIFWLGKRQSSET
ncbi:MAG: hypothetical protein ACOCTU_06575 [Bacteroidota bacterium]